MTAVEFRSAFEARLSVVTDMPYNSTRKSRLQAAMTSLRNPKLDVVQEEGFQDWRWATALAIQSELVFGY